jgi:hypothetical protein
MTAATAEGADRQPVADRRAHGTALNRLSFPELVARYEAAGFLYPAKRERLTPYLPEAAEAWSRMLRAGDALRRGFSWERGPRWASLDVWRSAVDVWTVQHLVANGGGSGARATMLAAVARALDDPEIVAAEAWFRPSNPFPQAVLGSSVEALGPWAARADHAYLAVPLTRAPVGARRSPPGTSSPVHVVESRDAPPDLVALAGATRHHAYATSIGLGSDPVLAGIDRRYRAVGLRRYRRIFLARDRSGRLLGAALVHRSPLAVNFSLLENRCDLLVAEADAAVSGALLSAAAEAYADFRPGFIPTVVAVDGRTDGAAQAHTWAGAVGGTVIQVYAQVVWLRPGLPQLAGFLDTAIRSSS